MIKATGAAYWACRSCVAYSQGITQKVKAVEREIENIKTDVKANKEGVKNIEATVEELKRQVEMNKTNIENAVTAAERRMGSEWREREIRRKNVVVHRLTEPGDDCRTAEERRQQDRANCGLLFGQIGLGELEQEIKTCRRLGERGREDRPLIVVLKTEEAKRKLLENAYKLGDTDYNEATIVPDLTPMQRKEEDDMRSEADRKNAEELTEEDQAKNLKWMLVGPRGEKRLIKAVDRGGYRGRGRGPMRGSSSNRGYIPQRPARSVPESSQGAHSMEQPMRQGGRTLRTPPQIRGTRRPREAEDEMDVNPSKR